MFKVERFPYPFFHLLVQNGMYTLFSYMDWKNTNKGKTMSIR
jgi:hypothetical protein